MSKSQTLTMLKPPSGPPRPGSPSLRQQPLEPRDLLLRVARTADPDDRLQGMLVRQPPARMILERLAAYLTDLVPTPAQAGRPLIDHCVAVARNEWILGCRRSSDPSVRFAHFLRGLLAPIPAVQQVFIHRACGAAWDPVLLPLASWWESHGERPRISEPPDDVYWRDILPIEFRMLVLSRHILTDPATLALAAAHLDFITDR